MKIDKNIKILMLCILVFTVSLIAKISFSVDTNVTSSEYTIKDNIITAVPTTYNYRAGEFLNKVSSNDDLTVMESDSELKVGDKVITGDKLKAGNSNYSIVVLGDLTKDGKIDLSDVSNLYNAYKGKITLIGFNVKAGDVTQNNKIDISDVSKLYNFYKGKSALSYFDNDMIEMDKLVDTAKSYYSSHSNSSSLGSNLLKTLSNSYGDSDRAIITKDGKVELAINKNNKCLRKNALSDYVERVDEQYCNVEVSAFASNAGKLHVDGRRLLNERNEEVILNGVSTEIDLLKSQKVLSLKALGTARNWGTNVVRIFVDNGIYQGNFIDNKDEYTEAIIRAMDTVIASDMYVILNWNPGVKDPKLEHSIDLFTRISTHYKNDPHVIYEIWNEAYDSSVTWQTMKDYSNTVIPVIKSNAPDAVILVCTPNGAEVFTEIKNDPLNYSNIMFVIHNYIDGMTDNSYKKMQSAIDLNIPIFVTEWAATKTGAPVGDEINEAFAMNFAKYLYRYKLSYTFFCFQPSQWSYGFTAQNAWDESLPDEVLTLNAKFYKRILQKDFDRDTFVLSNLSYNTSKFRSSEWINKIVSIEFKDKKVIPDNAVITWDLSQIQDESIIGYLVPSSETDMYDMVICADGKIEAPIGFSDFFKDMTKLKRVDLSNLYTNNTIHMNGLFMNDRSLEELDLSQFNVSKVSNMSSMFQNCNSLKSINTTGWQTGNKLEALTYAFYGCKKLKTIDVSGLDVTKVSSFDWTFADCFELEYINMSTWNPNDAVKFTSTFKNDYVLKEVDMTNMDFPDSVNFTNVFQNTNEDAVFYIKNPRVKNLFISSNLDYSTRKLKYKVETDMGQSGETTWIYDTVTSTLEITGNGAMADYSEDNLPPWYKYVTNIEKVIIGENVTSLGKYAFYNLIYVKEFRVNAISLANLSHGSDTNIGTNYTMYNTGKKYGMSLIFGENVTTVPSMFMAPAGYVRTTKVTDIKFEGSNITKVGYYGLSRLEVPALVLNEGITSNGGLSFGYSNTINLIVLPNSLQNVGDWSMNSNTELEKIVFGPVVYYIYGNTFSNCKNLKTLVIPHINSTSTAVNKTFAANVGKTITIYGDESTEAWVNNIRSVSPDTTLIYKNISEYSSSITSNTDINESVGYNGTYSFTTSGNIKAYYTYTNRNDETILVDGVDITKDGNTYTINNIKQDIYLEIE